MSSLLATRSARRRTSIWAVLLVISLLLMAFSSNPGALEVQRGIGFVLRPFQGVLDGAARQVVSVVDAVREIDRLRRENKALHDENDRLINENRTAVEAQRQLELTTGLLQIKNAMSYQTVAANVIARESSEFRRLVTIDKGTAAGIAVGNVVVADGGALAGRVMEVGPNYARIQLITDTASTVIGQFTTSPGTGEVVGQLQGVLVMGKVDAGVRIQLGEEVMTAGLELKGGLRSPYPKGLLIGQVVDVSRVANQVVQTAYLAPAANVEHLEYVLVITDYVGGLPTNDTAPAECAPSTGGTLTDQEQPCFTTPASPSPRVTPRPTTRSPVPSR